MYTISYPLGIKYPQTSWYAIKIYQSVNQILFGMHSNLNIAKTPH